MTTKKDTKRVLNRQSIADVALQETGTAESIVAIAQVNNLSVSDELKAYDEVIIDESKSKLLLVEFYNKKAIQPATSTTYVDERGGIGEMEIEGVVNPFVV